MTRNEVILRDAMLPLSVNKTDWEQAKREWELTTISFSRNKTCLCSHYPISELCHLTNPHSLKSAIVGNCCVTKFMELDSHLVFAAIKRIVEERNKSLNKATIEHAFTQEWINEWEHTFYLDTYKKRKLSDKQKAKREQINSKIIKLITGIR